MRATCLCLLAVLGMPGLLCAEARFFGDFSVLDYSLITEGPFMELTDGQALSDSGPPSSDYVSLPSWPLSNTVDNVGSLPTDESSIPFVRDQASSEPGPVAACVPVPAGAVAWWRAESNTVDTVGCNDGLFDRILYTAGKTGAGFRFLASPLFGEALYFAPASADLDLGAGEGLTIEGWLNPGSISGFQPVFEWNDGLGHIGAGLALSGSMLTGWFCDTNVSPVRRVVVQSGPGAITLTNWQHVALTFQKSDGHAVLYVNGAVVAQTLLGAFRPATRGPVYFASRLSGTNADTFYVGVLDELTLYNRALGALELQSIVAADSAGKCLPPPPAPAPVPSGIVGWWRGENNALDSVDSNHGVLVQGVGYTNAVVGKGFLFGTGFVRVPASSNLNVGVGPGFTLETWVWPEFASAFLLPLNREIFGWHYGTNSQGVSLSLSRYARIPTPLPPLPSSSSYWRANVVGADGLSHVVSGPADVGALEQWQHVALTYDKASGIAVLYFNGNPVCRTNLGSFTPLTTADLYLGYQLDGTIPSRLPAGALDEVSLYARALSADEIRSLALARASGKAKEPPSIVAQPLGGWVNAGDTVTLSVTAIGNPILKYQWKRGSTNLLGATTSSLVWTNIQYEQRGLYSVRITNAFGAVISSNVLVAVNRPPVADASATQPTVIAPLNCDATVVLDGSKSFDPDGDPLTFEWLKAAPTMALATGKVAVVTLSPGTYPLVLTVDDGRARASQAFTIHVLSIADALGNLISSVQAQVPKPQPLLASLSAALASVQRNAPTPAINQLQVFEKKLRAQVEPALADNLGQTALQLESALGVDCSAPKPTVRIAKVHRQADGKVKLGFSAPQGFAFVLEVSSDLVHWEKVARAVDSGTGEFEAEDSDASQPVRFYRLVTP